MLLKHTVMRHLKSISQLLVIGLLALPFASFAQFSDSIANFRHYDQRGINVFETPKQNNHVFSGLKVKLGAGFTQQFQSLKHENPTATNNTGTGSNRLYPLTPGFMTAQANLYLDVQLADGITLNVSNYMSSRHHNEFWVKGGYIQFDKLPFKGQFAENLMKIATIKVGHMEINYGDAHFRRSDGGHTFYNPFMESYIMDAFATEIGGEVYLKANGLFGMIGLTNGMIKGNVDSAYKTTFDDVTKKSPSLYGKVGIDKMLEDNIRVRFAASYYHNGSNAGSGLTLYGGDRTGSNYQNVMEKGVPGALPASTAISFSGRFNPGFSKKVDAFMLNGFLKAGGFELFGTYEAAKGRTKNETATRKASQFAVDGLYRIGKTENLFIGARYNVAKARLANTTAITYTGDVNVNRFAIAAGWYVSKNILLKGEIVNQKYEDFPSADYRSGGKFKGFVIEASVGF